jgi:hypothetical protein
MALLMRQSHLCVATTDVALGMVCVQAHPQNMAVNNGPAVNNDIYRQGARRG